jgi:lipoyl-dependent peroxiredoxin
VQSLRHQHGQTLDELAALSGLSKAYLSRIESGERVPSLPALFALARAWDIEVAAILAPQRDGAVTRLRRSAATEWIGSEDGEGTIRVGSGSVEGPYSQQLRVEGKGINPEELIAAAHAGCFTMKLSSLLTRAGYPPERLKTDAVLEGELIGDGFSITRINLKTTASVEGLSEDAFRRHASSAKRLCPVSRALAGVEISLEAELAS